MRNYFFFFLICISFCTASLAQDVVEMPPAEALDTAYTVAQEENSYKNEFGSFDTMPVMAERKINNESLERVRNDEAYWYANMEIEKKEKKPVPKTPNTNWLDTVFWILLVGGFIALLVWLLSSSNISLFRRSSSPIEEEQDEEGENIYEINFEKEIQQAITNKDYRLAVRLMYLQVLRQMADRGLIQYTHEKTNSDYLFHLSGSKYYNDFFRLTRNFDFVWYGKFPLSDEGFDLLRKDFSTFKQQLPR